VEGGARSAGLGQGGGVKKKSDVSKYLFWRLRKNFRDFFNRVFELPLLRNARKRDLKKSSKTTEGGKKNREKKATFFVMSSDGFL
jgi:hypothetical protein